MMTIARKLLFGISAICCLTAWAINPPTLQSPCGAGPQYDPALPIQLAWSSALGATNYQVQVSMDPLFTFTALDQTTPSTFSTAIGLYYDAHYYWRVRASDGAVWSAWSSNCDFYTMQLPAPPAPLLQAPPNNSVNLATTVGLQWSWIPATAIEIHIATSPTFSSATIVNTGGQNHTLNGLSTGLTYYWRVRGSNIGGTGPWSETWSFSTATAVTQLNARLFLQGPFNTGTFLMDDGLRNGGLIPSAEPYTALGFSGIANAGATVTPALLTVTGNNAVVDWVLMEVRHATAPTVLARWALLVQRDGDAMMPNGSAPSMSFPMGQVRIALRHRTHLGVLCSTVLAPNGTPVAVDFTAPTTPTYGTSAQAPVAGYMALWCGDVDRDGVVRYVGAANDRDPILTLIGGSVPTNTAAGAYHEDVNMDGVVRYVGSSNDRDPVLVTVGGSLPTATRTAQLP
ncbi:MAG: fibronectin type III domain-containing protein [Flavobacteriales bacterium]|nr:fibronectin type III domain-containing protein [Flavobacteriales bacterium]